MAIAVVENSGGKDVSWVAGDIIGEHENDIGVGDAQAFDSPVHGKRVGNMAVVEPEP